jgi:site-specific recombinase XerD
MTLGAPKGSTPANKGRKYPAEPLSRAEADRLIGACSARSATGMRNRALLAVMYRAGLRLDGGQYACCTAKATRCVWLA